MRGLAALPPVVATVYRGIPGDAETLAIVREKYTDGSHIHWSAFTSTSTNIAKAHGFASVEGIVYRIKVRTGRSVNAYSALPEEGEVLLSPNTRFLVASECQQATDGYHYVDLIEERTDAAFVF